MYFNRVSRIFIGDGVNSAALSSLSITNSPTIQKGDLVLVKKDMTVVTSNAAAQALPQSDPVYIAMGTGDGTFLLSSPIVPKNVTGYRGEAYSAPAEQVTYLGFNGTANTLSVTNSTEYVLRVVIKDELRVNPHRQTRRNYNYVTDDTATEVELINGVLKQLQKDTGNTYVKGEMVTDGTFAALGGTSTLAVTNGSVTAIASSGSHGLVAGSLVRIGGTGATTPVYQVVSVATTTITLATKYQGTTATVANANVGVLSGTANYGIKLTGKSIAYNGIDYYQKVRFDSVLTPINGVLGDPAIETVATKTSYGSGYWQQIRDMEYNAQPNQGLTNRTLFPNDELQYPGMYFYNSAASYHLIVIEHSDEHAFGLQQLGKSPVTTVIAIPSGLGATTNAQVVDSTAENFAYGLDGLFGTALGFGTLPSMS